MKGKIEKSNVEAIFELNGIQKGMLYHFLMEADENLYNVQLSFSIEGDLNPDTLQQAIHFVQSNNEALRSVFDWEKAGKPLQIVLREYPLSLKYYDISADAEEKILSSVQEYAGKDWSERFDLGEIPMRMQLIRTASRSFIFNITHHHLLYDGWSNGILLSELFGCYKQLHAGKTPVLAGKPGYKVIYKALLQKNDPEKAARFWKEYLKDYRETLLFVKDGMAPAVKTPVLQQRFSISAQRLDEFSAVHSVTKAAIIYAAYGLLLCKYSDSPDVLFGTTVSNRDLGLSGADRVVGNLINTVPLRMRELDGKTLLEVVVNVNRDMIDRNQFNGSALPEIRQILGLKPADLLYDSEIAIENYPIDLKAVNCNEEFTLQLRTVRENTDTPLSITVFLGEKVEIEFAYKASYMSQADASAVGQNLIGILEEILSDCHRKTDGLSLVINPEVIGQEEYIAPSRDVEEKLVKIWSELLNVGKIGVNKGFFDVGGDSLKLISLTARIRKELNLQISINDLAKYPTIRSFADFVSPVAEVLAAGVGPEEKGQQEKSDLPSNDIAIIGMAGRFPGAGNLAEFWENLRSGKESITKIDAVSEGPLVHAKGFLEGYDLFDTGFFDYIPTESQSMDPQMRIFHECSWEALEAAGYNPREYPGKIGLYGGASPSPFYNLDLRMSKDEDFVESWSFLTYADKDFLCPRVSYKLDLKGPSISIATACSTSLVAVDMACNELLAGKCDIAMAGGVSITLHDDEGYRFQKGMILSPDGKCRAFDKEAEGTVTGNGVGIVVLKKLADALRDGDVIHAIIKGTATNNDGSRKIGFTAPAVEGQSTVIKMAMTKAGVQPDSISYIEAHGTGTSLGDPIEIAALTDAFDTSKRQYCAIGSVKTNIGHLDAAAGVVGLIKTVLSLKNRQLPPSLHFQSPNPGIDFGNSPFYVNAGLQDWKNGQYPRRAGVSSFGFGGTNAHVILEEAPEPEASSRSREFQLLVVSAKTETALRRNVERLVNFLRTDDKVKLPDIAYTLQIGREHFPYRKMVVCKHRDEAIEVLTGGAKDTDPPVADHQPFIVLMFSGQGSQYVNMYADLYAKEPVFRETADECFGIAKRISGKDLKALVFMQGNTETQSEVDHTVFTQPLLFIMEYALTRLLMGWGVQPAAMIGHSIGEYVAACVSGAIALKDALGLVIQRGELMQQAPRGGMLSISISKEDLMPVLALYKEVSLAAVNSSSFCVVSGTEAAVASFKLVMDERGYETRVLRTSHAFHSPMMDVILGPFEKAVAGINIGTPRIPFLSNLTGKEALAAEIASPGYWSNHLRKEVKFSEGIEQLLKREHVIFIETGPGNTLATFVRGHRSRTQEHKVISLVKSHHQKADDVEYLLTGIGKLWQWGVKINWNEYYRGEKRQRATLPTYSFDQTKFPVKRKNPGNGLQQPESTSLVRNSDVSQWFYTPCWKSTSLLPVSKTEDVNPGYLIFADELGVSHLLADTFTRKNIPFIIVKKGERYVETSSNEYKLHPDREEDYKTLFTALSRRSIAPKSIIYAWTLTGQVGGGSIDVSSLGLFAPDFYPMVHITRKAHETGYSSGLHISLLTSGRQHITGDEKGPIGPSAVIGLLKVISQEYPAISASYTDILVAELNAKGFGNLLLNEVSKRDNGMTVALRNGRRWEQGFEKILFTPESRPGLCRNNGVYLITGGLGELGYFLARYLLKNYTAKIVLLGRSGLPERNTWNDPLADHNGDEEMLKKIRRMQALEKEEGEVLYLQCDVADMTELSHTVERAENAFGRINGVIHAAGITRGRSMDLISTLAEADFEEQYEAKVISLDALYRTLYSKELDFCLVVSSISSVLGGLRFGAYAPVNAAIDSYIAFLKDQDKADNWFYVDFDGLAFDDVQGEGVRTGELFTIFERLIALRELPGVIVSVGDLNKRWEKAVLFQNDIHYKASLPEPGQAMDGALDIVEQMTRLWQEFFGFDTIKVTDDFFELGGDSLKALTVIGRIQKRLHIDLSVTEFFNNSTIKKLSDHIRLVHLAEDEASDAPASLPMAERKAYYSLSSVQRRLHFLYEVDSQSIAYNQPLLLRLEGKPDISRLETVIGQLIRRHESLRTSFEIVNEQAEQRVLDEFAFKLEYYTATGNEKEIIKDFIRPFDLKAAPLFRGALISVSPDVHILAVDSHHIVMDRVSEALLLRDFSSLYANEQLPDLHFQYKDYAEWQQSDKQRAEMTAHKDFWIREFAEGAASPELPADYPRPAVKSYQGDLVSFELDAERTAALQKIAESEGATVFMLFLSLYSILLAKICNQEDIIIGAPISGRSHADLENITGMFVNTLPLRTYPKGELTYTAFLAQVKEKFLVSLDNQSYPYEALIDELKMERSANRNPLVDVWFAYEQDDRPAVVIPGLAITRYDYDHVVAKFDLGLLVSETGNSTRFTFEYPTELFKRETVEAFTAAFARIIESVIEDKTKRIAGIGILSADEKERLTYGYNNTKTEYPGDKTIIDLFGEQVRKTPENIACIAGDQTFSYRQLQERVDGIAAYLVRMKGIEPGDMVGIMLEREEYLIPCILGVLKAGGVYVPIDPGYPAERISYIIEDAKLKTLITRSKSLDASLRITCGVLNLDKEAEAVQAMPAGQPVGSKAGATAYVIYTSGSTGRPKGVMIGQRALVNYIHWAGAYYIKEERTIFPLYTSISFDLTITSIFTPLIMGRTVLLYREDGKDMLIEKVFTDRKANVIKLTPSHLKIIRDSEIVAPSGKERTIRLIVGGEDLETWLAKDIHEKFGGRVEIYNEYGPTEATVGCMIHRYSPEETLSSIPIGLPISNTQIYILDRSLAPVPVGVSGELFIAGDGLAEGYLFRPELTGEKFLDNPFIEGRKMYKTGDLACRLPDGNILFKGRMDDQIKLNGFRIELGEIEHRLLEHESIKEAVVMARERDGDKRLVAWYVAENDIGATGLRDFLGGKMPDYMLPSQFIHMSGLPLTPNGKLDRKALPEPELQSEKYTKPINEKQKEIAAIWSGILNIDEDKIGIHANFYEIGGNSIRMIKMINRVNKYFNAKISAAKMFELPTISLIADHLDKTEEEHADNILTEGEDSLEQMNETVDIINKM